MLFEKEQDGGYHAFCPTLKGCGSIPFWQIYFLGGQ
jgi:hypothetical protein